MSLDYKDRAFLSVLVVASLSCVTGSLLNWRYKVLGSGDSIR